MMVNEQSVTESADAKDQPQKQHENQRVLEEGGAALTFLGTSRVATSGVI